MAAATIDTTNPRPMTATAMLIFLASEAVFFLALILAWLYNRALADPAMLSGHDQLEVARAGVFTALLVLSSGTIWLAERSFKRANPGGLRWWLLATVALGIIFLLGQATEYATLYAHGVTIRSNLFGTQFYTLTGLHFLHVTAGVIMLAVLALLAFRGRSVGSYNSTLGPIAYYWHFVDVVWLVLFGVVYLLGAGA